MRCVGGALAQVTGDAVTKTETGGAPTTRYNDLFIIQHSTSKEVLCLLHKYCKWKYVFSTKWKHCSRKYSSKKRKENYPYVSMKNIFLKQSDGWASTVATIFFFIFYFVISLIAFPILVKCSEEKDKLKNEWICFWNFFFKYDSLL